ncbi:hypothetical protein BT63DRAFT_428788 [Microthyrium microscopicum]|uniref:Ig-like domain-containing protein n=1 Tax=Microthyrium microscopicum TaxID=703497 RepID=A0A6A6U1Q1_9PEZI|nr:hypothetical protein BT63DRAFT_428788 [Microthyrium microscopicum]
MVSLRIFSILASNLLLASALPYSAPLQVDKAASYSIVNPDGGPPGSNPTALPPTVTQTVYATTTIIQGAAAPPPATITITITATPPTQTAIETDSITVTATTTTPVTTAASVSTEWYDNGMWHTSYYTVVPIPSPTEQAQVETTEFPSTTITPMTQIAVATSLPFWSNSTGISPS